MKFGAQLVNYFTSWDEAVPTVRAVEAGRWHSLWYSDHFLPPLPGAGREADVALEGWSMITATAAITERLRLGLMVTGNTYRNPALLAKMAATVDQISHGRLNLGIGAAWYQREHEAYGWTFPGLKERCERLEEALKVIRMLFNAKQGEFVDYQGDYYTLDNAPFSPQCFQNPHVPILVGGNGEKRTLLSCAKYADICNIDFHNPGGVDVFKHKIDVLKRHCDAVGRNPDEIAKTMLMPFHLTDDEARAAELRRTQGDWKLFGSASYIVDQVGQYIDAGAEEIMFAGVPTRVDYFQRIDEEILSKFD